LKIVTTPKTTPDEDISREIDGHKEVSCGFRMSKKTSGRFIQGALRTPKMPNIYFQSWVTGQILR